MSLCDEEVYSYDPVCEFSFSPVQNLSKMFEYCDSPDFCPYSSSLLTSSTAEDHADIIDSCMEESNDESSSPPLFATPWRAAETPASKERCFWDSAIGTSLTPVASSTMVPGAPRRPSYRGSGLLPIPFGYDDCEKADDSAEDEAAGDLPTTPPAEPSSASEQGAVTTPLGRSMLSLNISQTPKSLLHRRAAQKSVDRAYRMKMASSRERRAAIARRGGGICRPSDDPHGPQTNINPFVTAAIGSSSRYDSSFNIGISGSPHTSHHETATFMDVLEDSGIDRSSSSSKLSLRQINTSRFDEEFHIMETVGNGQFGVVYKCINRMDGCVYAIKKSRFPVAGSSYERNAINEVFAYSVLGRHAHIVHYFSSWVEDDRVFIQTEYCNGGSLSSLLTECRSDGRKHLTETELKQLTVHIATGLKYIHSHGLVHLDIKPDNILIQRVGGLSASAGAMSVYDGSMDEGLGEESIDELDHTMYKIGDLGQVASVMCQSVDEGDCRYLPCELLADQSDDLPKADVFSLALTVLEAGSGVDLPPNGPLWHEYRRVGIPDLPHVSAEFNALLKSMSTLDVKRRPLAACVTQHAALMPFSHKSSSQLRRELCDEKMKNDMLTREVDETRRAMLELQRQMMSTCPPAPGHRSQRLVGRSCGRSRSLIAF